MKKERMMKKKIVVALDSNLEGLPNLEPGTVIHAFKVVRADGSPPANPRKRPRLRYEVGRTVIVRNYDTNRAEDCGAGLNVATLKWCRKICYGDACNALKGDKLITVTFAPADIVCIPYNTEGKFRVKRLTVIKSQKVNWR